MWKYVAGILALGSLTYGLKRFIAGGKCQCSQRLDGLIIIVTGANSGIGKALALELAKRGATLILACRNTEKGLAAAKDIESSLYKTQVNIFVKYLDLNSFDSIFNFCDTITREFKEIYALVNNAGVFYHPRVATKDCFDVTLQTNYLGPFILTHYMLRVLKNSDHARIINVVSDAHRFVDSYDLKKVVNSSVGDTDTTHFVAYAVSKLALTLFTKELAKKLAKTNVIVNCVDPGNVETQIYRYFPPLASNTVWFWLQWPLRLIIVKRPSEGAQSALHALITTNRSTGQYLTNCKAQLPARAVLSPTLSTEFYEMTLELLGDKFITESDC